MKNYALIVLILIGGFIYAQEENKTSLDEGTLLSQYEYLRKKSGNHKSNSGTRYEVVLVRNLEIFKQNILDSIYERNTKITHLNASLKNSSNRMDSLQSLLGDTKSSLVSVEQEKESMSFFGASIKKSSYKGVVWTLIFLLIGALGFFIFKFRNSNYLTRQAKSALDEMEKEFEQHKRRALEREQKLSRELLDERNKKKKQRV